MAEQPPDHIVERIQNHKQQHLLDWWNDLTSAERDQLVREIESIDFELVNELLAQARSSQEKDGASSVARAHQAQPPRQLVRLPKTADDRATHQEAAQAGEQALRSGQVGALLVAGGQGTRLEFPQPKGMYPIGPVSGRTLFQIFSEQLLARARQAGVTIPYYIMTSDATHDETVAFFEQHNFFGLNSDAVFFFRQGNMPAADIETGRLLLSSKGGLGLSPDGHGGMVAALARAGLFDDMRSRGIEYLYYHQVDNPTAIVCDPVFLGLHITRGSEMSTKVVAKRSAEEKMGVLVDLDGTTQIIEYSDLPDEVAQKTDSDGELLLWAGNTAVHAMNRDFLERMAKETLSLPFHLAQKKVPFITGGGESVAPDAPNAWKFERFLFDALPHAKNALVVEADRVREFNPVKSKEGHDSPETAKRAMADQFRSWLRAAGAVVSDEQPVEICPLFALDPDELKRKLPPGSQFSGPLYLT